MRERCLIYHSLRASNEKKSCLNDSSVTISRPSSGEGICNSILELIPRADAFQRRNIENHVIFSDEFPSGRMIRPFAGWFQQEDTAPLRGCPSGPLKLEAERNSSMHCRRVAIHDVPNDVRCSCCCTVYEMRRSGLQPRGRPSPGYRTRGVR